MRRVIRASSPQAGADTSIMLNSGRHDPQVDRDSRIGLTENAGYYPAVYTVGANMPGWRTAACVVAEPASQRRAGLEPVAVGQGGVVASSPAAVHRDALGQVGPAEDAAVSGDGLDDEGDLSRPVIPTGAKPVLSVLA